MGKQTADDRRFAEKTGRWAEYLTLWVYRLQGYRCSCRRCRTPFGEIDLLMKRGRRILVLEVKFRTQNHLPEEMALPSKTQCQRIRQAALWLTKRLVLQLQRDGRLGLVVHGLDDGQSITPESQPALLRHHEQRLHAALPEVLQPWPQLQHALEQAESYGVMRWGAAVPTAGGLPAHLQWCEGSSVGFAGDWINGPGYGCGEGALRSAVALAEQLKLP